MAKNDFDIDFDFEEEYGFDPKAILGSDYEDADLDLENLGDEFLDVDLSEDAAEAEPDYSDFDVDSLDLDDLKLEDDDLEADVDLGEEEPAYSEEAEEEEEENLDLPEDDFEDDFDEDFDAEEEDLLDFSRRASFFETQEAPAEQEIPDYDEQPQYEEPVYEAPAYEQPAYEEAAVEEEISQQLQQMQELDDQEDFDSEEPEKPRNSRRRQPAKEKTPVKLTVPPVLLKLVSLYIPPKNAFDPQPDPNNPRRRRRKSKLQIFKEAYLPTILACLTLITVIYFCAGAIGHAIERKRVNDKAAMESSQAAASEAERVADEAERIMEEAKLLAAGYNYDDAITMLESFSGKMEDYPDMVNLKSEYVTAQGSLVEIKDISSIPNLSFHVLIEDPTRAFTDKEYGGQYNRNFVTTEEFSRILEQLYANGYVLVDFDSFISGATGTDGSQTFFAGSIYLPEGKKPVMITETMVNYFNYMIDSDADGAYGDGFASKLVVTPSGDVKAEYVNADGQTLTGDYDLVPILETFIKEHPDFSYRGARATLAVTGMEGIFGYRINTSVISTKGNDYYNEQVVGATKVVEALKAKGYTMACFTYDNVSYSEKNANQISADLTSWTNEITPVLGSVDILVYARTADIGDYTGNKFTVLHNAGFRYFVTNGDQASTTVNSSYIKQSRLMVTGNSLAWKSTIFSQLFDCNAVINLTARGGSVPN